MLESSLPRVLLDECVDSRLARELTGHDVTTVPEAGWAGTRNGELLAVEVPMCREEPRSDAQSVRVSRWVLPLRPICLPKSYSSWQRAQTACTGLFFPTF